MGKRNSNDIGQSVLKGSIILVIANLLVKIIGALFKVPLTNLLGNEGMGYFSSAYQIYSGLFTVATAGLPVAIAKMVAETTASKNLKELKRIHYVSYAIFGVVGVVGTAVLYFGADHFIKEYGDNSLCIKLVAPAIFFVAIMSVYRGFFQGLSDMYPTAFSELIESGTKLVLGFSLAYILLKRGLVYGASGAISGVTLGSVFGCIFLIGTFLVKKNKIYSNFNSNLKPSSVKSIFCRLMGVALPVTVSASVFTITNLIDLFQIGKRLSRIAFQIPLSQLEKCMKITETTVLKAEEIANSLYGMYTAKVITMLNLIPALVVALCLPLVPAIARAFSGKKFGEVATTTKMSIKFTVIFSLPGAVGIGVLADPMLTMLFGSNDATVLLRLITPAIVFVSVVLVTNAILQATGNVLIPVINIAIAGITKVIINYFLLVIPSVNINGVSIGTSACYFVYMILNLYYVIRVTKPGMTIKDIILKPSFSAGVMGIIVWFANSGLAKVLGQSRNSSILITGASIAVGGIVYVICLFKTGSLSQDEISQLPKGDLIVGYLKKFRLI
ncbi:MAG: polysaccharide biosynthesis protein [Clostridia bacterium]|nr:polysaccharide biosynthesis protein [Clostridia bacterium]